MKRIIAAVLSLLLLCALAACKPEEEIAGFENPGEDTAKSNDPAEKPEPMLVESRTTVSHYNISLSIPDDWEYEILKGEDNADYCIAFWPAGETEGRIKMAYFEFFGVCGTGLTVEEITVGDYQAQKGTYDNHWLWDYISFIGTPGSYVAINDGAETWWSQYGEEAMVILSQVKIAEGIITREQAIEIAKPDVTVEYNQIDASFDTDKGEWKVMFSMKDTLDGEQVFTITHEGKIINVEYGG